MNEDGGELPPVVPEKRPPVHFREWIGVLLHTHTQLQPDLSLPKRDREILKRWRGEGGSTPLQFTVPLLAETAKRLGEKKGGFFVVDTPHPGHSLSEYHADFFPDRAPDEVRKLRRELFSPEKLEDTVATISENMDLRRCAVEKERRQRRLEGRVFTGVEADILDASGKLDVNQETLSRLDVVVASFHKDEWIDVNGKEPAYAKILEAYLNLSRLPYIDVIGHPGLPKNYAPTQEDWQKWDEIFNSMAKQGKCLEIAFSCLINPQEKEQLLQLIKKAKDRGVGLMINVDFHRLESFFLDTLMTGKEQPAAKEARQALEKLSNVAKQSIEGAKNIQVFEAEFTTILAEIFKEGEGAFGVPKYLTTLARPIYYAIRELQEAGISPENIINGEIDRFNRWITERKIRKEAFPLGDVFDPMINLNALLSVQKSLLGKQEVNEQELLEIRLKQITKLKQKLKDERKKISPPKNVAERLVAEINLRKQFPQIAIGNEKENAASLHFHLKFGDHTSEKSHVDSVDKLKQELQDSKAVCLWVGCYLFHMGTNDQGEFIDLSTGDNINQTVTNYFAALKILASPGAEVWKYAALSEGED